AAEGQLGEGVAGQGVDQQRAKRDRAGHQQAVEEVATHAGAREERVVVLSRDRRGQQRRREAGGLASGHERNRHHPQQRRQARQRKQQQRAIDQQRMQARLPDLATGGLPGTHTTPLRRPSRSINEVTARITTNSRNATAEARPRVYHLKTTSKLKYSTLTVLCSGSPRVIT